MTGPPRSTTGRPPSAVGYADGLYLRTLEEAYNQARNLADGTLAALLPTLDDIRRAAEDDQTDIVRLLNTPAAASTPRCPDCGNRLSAEAFGNYNNRGRGWPLSCLVCGTNPAGENPHMRAQAIPADKFPPCPKKGCSEPLKPRAGTARIWWKCDIHE